MQSLCLDACKTITWLSESHPCNSPASSHSFSVGKLNFLPVAWCKNRHSNHNTGRVNLKGGKENVWSVDNEMAEAQKGKEKIIKRKKKKRGVRKVMRTPNGDFRVLVSGAMLIDVETVLQTQEPVILPAWNTFASSVSGIWKGVGAAFSPITAEMEPIEVGSRNEHLFDCYTLSHIEVVPSISGQQKSQIQRRINWVTLNPEGEDKKSFASEYQLNEKSHDDDSFAVKKMSNKPSRSHKLPNFESFDFARSDIMEEDQMGLEPGLVFFEDGSYSRGPLDIPVSAFDDSKYYLSPTFKFEQCLVKGCHKRLRIVHTIEFGSGGTDIQIMRVAVYEEQWVSPASIPDDSDLELDLLPLSQRKRVQPSELTGSWKVFEVSATPIYGDDLMTEESSGAPYVYLCTETLKKRSLPENAAYFGEEEILDSQDVTMLWLPGGVTAYVDVNKDGVLCIGVGWYSDEGINLVMERDYGTDGKLKEVRSKSEMKRRWSNPPPM